MQPDPIIHGGGGEQTVLAQIPVVTTYELGWSGRKKRYGTDWHLRGTEKTSFEDKRVGWLIL